jgi:hypothetical protein
VAAFASHKAGRAPARAGGSGSHQQDADSPGQPVTTVLVTAYLLSYVIVSADASSVLAHVLTILPLTSPFVLPARSAPSACRSGSTRPRSS